MLKSEAQHILQRAIEETKAEFTAEQIDALAEAMMNIAARVVEEAAASLNQQRPGGRSPGYFA